jgi:hypothetical protein
VSHLVCWIEMIYLLERLASLTNTTTNLIAQLRELNQLRERVRGQEAQLAGRRSFRTSAHRTSSGWTGADTKKGPTSRVGGDPRSIVTTGSLPIRKIISP